MQPPLIGLEAHLPRPTAPEAASKEPSAASLRPEVLRPKALALATALKDRLGVHVQLAVTDNRSTMVSFRRRPGALVLRLHHLFLDAPEEIVDVLARFVGHDDRSVTPRLDAWLKTLRPPTARRAARSGPLRSKGLFHDLQAMFEEANARWFGGRIEARIGWGRHIARRGRRSIRMGVYMAEEKVIRIHPALDRPEVPAFFVAFVVFHEMLHQAVPSARCEGGRREHHGPEFRARERAHPDHARSLAWERQNLDLLLGRAARRGEPVVR